MGSSDGRTPAHVADHVTLLIDSHHSSPARYLYPARHQLSSPWKAGLDVTFVIVEHKSVKLDVSNLRKSTHLDDERWLSKIYNKCAMQCIKGSSQRSCQPFCPAHCLVILLLRWNVFEQLKMNEWSPNVFINLAHFDPFNSRNEAGVCNFEVICKQKYTEKVAINDSLKLETTHGDGIVGVASYEHLDTCGTKSI